MEEFKQLNNIKYQVEKSHRKTLGISLIKNGIFLVKVPEIFTVEQVETYLLRNEITLHKALAASKVISSDREFVEGEDYYYLGRNYRLKIIDNSDKELSLEGDYFTIGQFVGEDYRGSFQDWYTENLFKVIQEKINLYKMTLGIEPSKVTIDNLTEKWGACTPTGMLKFNWKLAMAPLSIIDYIVVHEMVHLKIKNHSTQFWSTVHSICPRYQDSIRWLKENGHELSL